MVAAVEVLPLPGVDQPEVRAAVDHDHVIGQLVHECGRGAVGKSEEDDLMTGQRLRGGLDDYPVRQRGEVGMDGAKAGACAGRRGECSHRHVGVSEQQPQDLPAGIAAGTCHCRLDHHAHDYTQSWECMQGEESLGD